MKLRLNCLALLLGAGIFVGLDAQSFISPDISAAVSRNVFEVVVLKPTSDPFTYAERLPVELLPFSEQTDLYYSIGTAFSLGKGVFVSAGHVFSPETRSLRTQYGLRDANGKVYPIGTVLKYSYWKDYIVFQVPGLDTPGLPTAPVPKLNSRVFAIGNALGQGVIIRDGILTSQTPEDWKGAWKWMRFSAPASPGNSGGPLIDTDGNVLGIVLMKSENENLNFALPISEIDADAKARFDFRGTYIIPNIIKPAYVEGHVSFDMPLDMDALRGKVSTYLSKLYSDAAGRVVSEDRDGLFPRSPKSNANFGDSHVVSFLSILTQQADDSWKIDTAKDIKDASVGKDGKLSYGDFLGYTFMALSKPSDQTLASLFSGSKDLMDLVLQGYALSRPIGNRQIRITSFGAPSDFHSFSDSWGRRWFVSVWNAPQFDLSFMLISLPVPGGLVTVYKQAPYGAISEYEDDFRVLSDFAFLSYKGTLAEWKEFLATRELVPSLFSAWDFSYEKGKYVSVDTPRFSWYTDAKNIDVDDSSMMYAQTAYFHERDSYVWDVGTFWYVDGPEFKNSVILSRMLKPDASKSEQDRKNWQALLGHNFPYDGSQTRSDNRAIIRFAALPDPSQPAGTEPVFGDVLIVAFDGTLNSKSVDGKAAEIFRGLFMKSNEKARAAGVDPAALPLTRLTRIEGRTVFDAIRAGDTALVSRFVFAKTDLNAKNEDGLSPLIFAIEAGENDVASSLIEAGADPDTRDPRSATALHYALRHGYPDLAQKLIDLNANPQAADSDGVTPLMLSMDPQMGDLPLTLIGKGADIRAVSATGKTALGEAIRAGRDDLALSLVNSGAPIDVKDSDGWTALLLSIRFSCPQTLSALLDKKADLGAKTKDGWTVLDLALRFDSPIALDIILETRAGINEPREDGGTALSIAAQFSDLDKVKALLAAGADPERANRDGWTPLMFALRYGTEDVASHLISVSSVEGLKASNSQGWNALHFAARYKPELLPLIGETLGPAHADLLKSLINAQTRTLYTPLELAVVSKSPEAIEWLRAQGADASLKNDEKKTALDLAVQDDDMALVHVLSSP